MSEYSPERVLEAVVRAKEMADGGPAGEGAPDFRAFLTLVDAELPGVTMGEVKAAILEQVRRIRLDGEGNAP